MIPKGEDIVNNKEWKRKEYITSKLLTLKTESNYKIGL